MNHKNIIFNSNLITQIAATFLYLYAAPTYAQSDINHESGSNSSSQSSIYFYIDLQLLQDRKTGTGVIKPPVTLQQVSIKEDQLVRYKGSIKIAEKTPLTTRTTQNGGCLYIKEKEITCAGIKRYSDESNVLISIWSNLDEIDYIEALELDAQAIKSFTSNVSGRKIENLAPSRKDKSRLTCGLVENAILNCMLLLTYTANLK